MNSERVGAAPLPSDETDQSDTTGDGCDEHGHRSPAPVLALDDRKSKARHRDCGQHGADPVNTTACRSASQPRNNAEPTAISTAVIERSRPIVGGATPTTVVGTTAKNRPTGTTTTTHRKLILMNS
jgi:hypothetical protein